MKRWLWAAAAVAMAFASPLMLDGLDQWMATNGWFPRDTGAGGLEGVAFAALFAASLAEGGWRRLFGALSAAIIAVVALWAERYLVGVAAHRNTLITDAHTMTVAHWILMFTASGLGGWLARFDPRRGRDWAIQVGLLLASVWVADGLVAMMGIDSAAMNKVLYYQTVELEVHTPVNDAERLYGLKPGARLGGEGPWGLRTVTVNQRGARSPEYPVNRPPSTERTLVFGGSTLYGAGVGNGDATPGAMDRMMGREHEVWNFGVCAFNTAQAAHLAMAKIDELAPNRVILMITNTGRRAFMGGPVHQDADKSAYFEQNPFLYIENFPPSPGQAEAWHRVGLQHSALYRTFAAWKRATSDPDTTFSDRADRSAVTALERHAAAQGVEVLYVLSPSRGSEVGPTDFGVPADRWLDLNIPGRSGDYQQAHPPPKVLSEYATAIIRWMKRRSQGPAVPNSASGE